MHLIVFFGFYIVIIFLNNFYAIVFGSIIGVMRHPLFLSVSLFSIYLPGLVLTLMVLLLLVDCEASREKTKTV